MERIIFPVAFDKIDEFLGGALVVIRAIRGYTQREMARILSKELGKTVSSASISKVEKSHSGIGWKRLALFCKVLQCKPSDVVRVAESLALQSNHEGTDSLRDGLADVAKLLGHQPIAQATQAEGSVRTTQEVIL